MKSFAKLPTLAGLGLGVCIAVGCAAAPPRVLEVSSTTHLRDISPADESIFVHDRASRFRYLPRELPEADRRQEFYVRWTPSMIEAVKFEYRQVNIPNRVFEQTHASRGDTSASFSVRGEDFLKGGPVSAWRVSLWKGDQLLAEKNSALW